MSYTDTLTEGGRGESGSTCTVHASYCVLHGYSDRGGKGGIWERVEATVSYTDTLTF